MKKTLLFLTTLFVTQQLLAQTDTTTKKTDTLVSGNFIIVKKPNDRWNKYNDSSKKRSFVINIGSSRKKRNSNISTNWWIFDLGFTNLRDNTNYANAQAGSYLKTLNTTAGAVNESSMKLNAGKSSNFNIWFFMQKLNVHKRVVNLKYGLGLEMYNFRYDRRISYRKDPNPIVFNDTINFSKNKLYVGYITAPLMVNINTAPSKNNPISFSAGVSAGYLISSRNKQVSDARGKDKYKGDFNLQPFRLAAIAEIGLGDVRLFGSYSLNKLHDGVTRLEQYPYSFGIRFSNW
jgi:Outer membrane protein beta-barrel domain